MSTEALGIDSAATSGPAAAPSRGRRASLLPGSVDPVAFAIGVAAVAAMYVPTCLDLARTVWRNSDQSQGPLMLLAAFWLLHQRLDAIALAPTPAANRAGSATLAVGMLLYIVGRSQSIWLFEVGSLIVVLTGLLLLFKGRGAVRAAALPLFFLVFVVPLPGPMVSLLTAPLKSGVSYVASEILFAFGYPVSRSGVILTVGPYMVLVADACAGLTSMFSLEALGLLYLHIVRHESALRNVLLSVLVIPISLAANVIRVVVLVLVTYHLGDAAGRGFLHGFAGLMLFVIAMALLFVTDRVLGLFLRGATARGAR